MRNKIQKIIGIIIFILFILINAYFIMSIQNFNIIPNKYMIIVYAIMFILLLISLLLVTRKNIVAYIIGIIFTILISSGYIIGTNYINEANNTLKKIAENKITTVNYYLLVRKDSDIETIEDVKNKKIGYIKDGNSDELINLVNSKVKSTLTPYEDYHLIINDFLSDTPIILNSGYTEALGDEVSSFSNSYKIIHTFTIEEEKEVENETSTNIAKEPFLLYISGIDTYGDITTRSRSDVNILLAVNPKTHKILLVNTPRDYYVQLHGTTGLKDKLTHAGIYGIDKSITTLEDLYGADINNYVRVNFNTLIKIVDEIGGIDIESDTAFTAHTNKKVKVVVGMNHFNGEQALAYARERYAYTNGDRHRGENQQQVITAIINKVTSTDTLISKYDKILNTLSNSFETDLTDKEIKEFAKAQLNNNTAWNIESISVDGTGAKNYTYSMGTNYLLYVMVPDQNTVNIAKEKINQVLTEK